MSRTVSRFHFIIEIQSTVIFENAQRETYNNKFIIVILFLFTPFAYYSFGSTFGVRVPRSAPLRAYITGIDCPSKKVATTTPYEKLCVTKSERKSYGFGCMVFFFASKALLVRGQFVQHGDIHLADEVKVKLHLLRLARFGFLVVMHFDFINEVPQDLWRKLVDGGVLAHHFQKPVHIHLMRGGFRDGVHPDMMCLRAKRLAVAVVATRKIVVGIVGIGELVVQIVAAIRADEIPGQHVFGYVLRAAHLGFGKGFLHLFKDIAVNDGRVHIGVHRPRFPWILPPLLQLVGTAEGLEVDNIPAILLVFQHSADGGGTPKVVATLHAVLWLAYAPHHQMHRGDIYLVGPQRVCNAVKAVAL